MDTHDEFLEIIDEDENIIGRATRDEVHDKGLLHREVHVWLCTPDKQIIFQKRALTKDTEPGLLDATAGGHIDDGFEPLQAALDELKEETGIDATASDLQFLGKFRKNAKTSNGRINNVIRYVFGYQFSGTTQGLKVEDGKSDGFVAYNIEQLHNLDELERAKFIPQMIGPEYMGYFDKLTSR